MDSDVLKIGCVYIMIATILLALTFVAFALCDRQACIETGETMSVNTEWRLFAGCFLELDSRMLPQDQWYYIKFGYPPD